MCGWALTIPRLSAHIVVPNTRSTPTLQPLKKLSSERPPATVFNWASIISILGQFGIHIASLAYCATLCAPYHDS